MREGGGDGGETMIARTFFFPPPPLSLRNKRDGWFRALGASLIRVNYGRLCADAPSLLRYYRGRNANERIIGRSRMKTRREWREDHSAFISFFTPTIINDEVSLSAESLRRVTSYFRDYARERRLRIRGLSAGLSQLLRLHYDIANPWRDRDFLITFDFKPAEVRSIAQSATEQAKQNASWILDTVWRSPTVVFRYLKSTKIESF